MNRIPKFEDVVQWATAMYEAGLAYHIDDNPDQLTRILGGHQVPLFSLEERDTLNEICNSLTIEQRDLYFQTVVALSRANYLSLPTLQMWEALMEQEKIKEHKRSHFDNLNTALRDLLANGPRPVDFRLALLSMKGTALSPEDQAYADRYEASWQTAMDALTAANTKST
jgi:hypothetical protein